MRKRLPMSALITGLLAAPVLGATGLSTPKASPAVVETIVRTFPAEMPADIGERMRRIARGEKVNAYGMQGLHNRMTRAVQSRIARRRAEGVPPTPVFDVAPLTATALVPVSAPASVARVERVAYLGVAPSAVNEALATQLQLPRGVGLVIEFVDPGSPADKAGLLKNDVLQKLDDQLLINPAQMQVLVRSKKAGEAVAFTVIRGGKAMDIKVTLGEKTLEVADFFVPATPEQAARAGAVVGTTRRFSASSMTVNGDGSVTRRVRDDEHDITLTKTRNTVGTVVVKSADGQSIYEGPAEGVAQALPAPVAKKVQDLIAAPDEVRVELQQNAGRAAPGERRSFTLSRSDGEHEILIQSEGNGRHLTIKDAAGNKLFDAPANTDADLKDLSPALRVKVDAAMEKVK